MRDVHFQVDGFFVVEKSWREAHGGRKTAPKKKSPRCAVGGAPQGWPPETLSAGMTLCVCPSHLSRCLFLREEVKVPKNQYLVLLEKVT